MGKVLFAVCAFLALCIAGLGLVAYLGREEDRVAVDNLLAEALTREIQTAQGRGEEVDLARLTDFRWDRVLIVAPDTPPAAIDRALGSEFRGDLNYSAETGAIFVFARGTTLVRFADYRGRGRFEGIEEPIAELGPDEAVFTVDDLVIRPR